MTTLPGKHHQYNIIRITVLMAVLSIYITSIKAENAYRIYSTTTGSDTITGNETIPNYRKKSFAMAAGETFGMNMGLWAFDRYVLKGHYAYISLESIKENFKHGFEWDNDHLNTNMFAHPYNGSLFFNAGRSNGFNFWQSELFAIGGSAMWEMFMECEYPSTNDIIATPVGGAALGEVFYRTSDMILDDRSSGAERFGRELASFIISPMRGITRLLTGKAWKRSSVSGREFSGMPLNLEVSLGTRMLSHHDNRRIIKAGASTRLKLEYGDPFDGDSKTPYDYFSFIADINAMQTQPLLNHIEITGRLLSKELISNNRHNLSIGLYQHFDFFDSDTISANHEYKDFKPCAIPYKLGVPASVGAGAMFRYKPAQSSTLNAFCHVNGVILGGLLSDHYRFYNRNYNWSSGFSVKMGADFSIMDDRFKFSLRNQLYKLYSWQGWDWSYDWSQTPEGKPVNVQGDESTGFFCHLEGHIDYQLWKKLHLGLGVDWYHRFTTYSIYSRHEYNGIVFYTSEELITSRQLSFQLMLTYKL